MRLSSQEGSFDEDNNARMCNLQLEVNLGQGKGLRRGGGSSEKQKEPQQQLGSGRRLRRLPQQALWAGQSNGTLRHVSFERWRVEGFITLARSIRLDRSEHVAGSRVLKR